MALVTVKNYCVIIFALYHKILSYQQIWIYNLILAVYKQQYLYNKMSDFSK